MNLADHEYLISLDTYMSLKKTHDPVEMRIFPNEYHIKWQPAHTAVLYESNLDWFNFWLRGLIDPDPAKKAQYERWGKLKAEASVGSDAPTSHGSR